MKSTGRQLVLAPCLSNNKTISIHQFNIAACNNVASPSLFFSIDISVALDEGSSHLYIPLLRTARSRVPQCFTFLSLVNVCSCIIKQLNNLSMTVTRCSTESCGRLRGHRIYTEGFSRNFLNMILMAMC